MLECISAPKTAIASVNDKINISWRQVSTATSYTVALAISYVHVQTENLQISATEEEFDDELLTMVTEVTPATLYQVQGFVTANSESTSLPSLYQDAVTY